VPISHKVEALSAFIFCTLEYFRGFLLSRSHTPHDCCLWAEYGRRDNPNQSTLQDVSRVLERPIIRQVLECGCPLPLWNKSVRISKTLREDFVCRCNIILSPHHFVSHDFAFFSAIVASSDSTPDER